MNVIEKGMWLRKFPKDIKSEVKILLNRVNFHDIKDMGNEDYVINIINETCVVDKKDCEGELYIMSAGSRFKVKNLRYRMRFAEKNEMILLKESNMHLTEAEDLALDRYMALFCSTIKIELDYHVSYGVKIIESPVQTMPVQQTVPVQPVPVQPVPVQQTVPMTVEVTPVVTQKIDEVPVEVSETVPEKEESNEFSLENIYKAVMNKGGSKISLTSYCKEGIFGVNVDVDGKDAACIEIAKNENLEDIDQIRAIATAISLVQALGSYLRLKDNNFDIKFYYYQDVELSIHQLPENFIDLSGAIAISVQN